MATETLKPDLVDTGAGEAQQAPSPQPEPLGRATFRIWRGDGTGGRLVDYSTNVAPGMVVLDAIHHLRDGHGAVPRESPAAGPGVPAADGDSLSRDGAGGGEIAGGCERPGRDRSDGGAVMSAALSSRAPRGILYPRLRSPLTRSLAALGMT